MLTPSENSTDLREKVDCQQSRATGYKRKKHKISHGVIVSQPTGYLIMYYSGELSQISLHSRAYVRIVDKEIQDSYNRFWIPRRGFRIPGTGFPIFFSVEP